MKTVAVVAAVAVHVVFTLAVMAFWIFMGYAAIHFVGKYW